MTRRIILLVAILWLAAASRGARSSDAVAVQPSIAPNLEAPIIAARQQAKAGIADVVEYAAKLVSARAFNALFAEKSAGLVAQGKAKVENGADVALIVTEVYTNPLTGSVEIGPMSLVEGASVIAALKAYVNGQNTSKLIKDRSRMKKSYMIKVLTKANIAAGFLDEAFPDQMMAVATQQLSIEEKAQATREAAQEAAKAATAAKARDVKSKQTRDSDGPRGGDARLPRSPSGSARSTESSKQGTETKGGKNGDKKGEGKGEVKGDVDGQEIRQLN